MSWLLKARDHLEAEQTKVMEQLADFSAGLVLDFMVAHGWRVTANNTEKTVLAKSCYERLILFNDKEPWTQILRMLEAQSERSKTPLQGVIAELKQAKFLRGTLIFRAKKITTEIHWAFAAWRTFEFEDEPLYVGVIEEALQELLASGTCSLLGDDTYDQELAAFTLLHYSELAEVINSLTPGVSLTTALMSTEHE